MKCSKGLDRSVLGTHSHHQERWRKGALAHSCLPHDWDGDNITLKSGSVPLGVALDELPGI